MEDLIIKLFEDINYSQAIFLIIIAVILYYKIKNNLNTKLDEVKTEINGLGQRFDNQFGEYKDKNRNEIDSLKERVCKLEVEIYRLNPQKQTYKPSDQNV
ncbi:MAG: hypothetical protein A2Y25_04605 [Candidatus Melainabacteria bacterium GWF2_37_15]|nr:MAG: hypothetical protein A2Y25_04605 [Candidatus Melainabacteria bacterium GWF2_37_15]